MTGHRTTLRDPLCEEALRTNRELRVRCEMLERRLLVPSKHLGLRSKLTAVEIENRELRASPWTYLPWRGYVS